MATLAEWMKAATVAEQDQLAKAINSHRLSLFQYAKKGVNYSRKINAVRAAKLETASLVMHNMTKDRKDGPLPIMRREELADECGVCPHVRGCNGDTK